MHDKFWQRQKEQKRERERDRLNELALEELLMEIRDYLLTGRECDFWPGARCSKPDDMTCAEIRCPLWSEIDGE